MQAYAELLQRLINAHNTHSSKWRSKIRHQSTLSSYHTTKRAQIQTIASSDNLVQLLEARRQAIEEVIKSYQKKIGQMYPKVFGKFTRKHHRSDRMERLFNDEYSDLSKADHKLQSLRADETKLRQVIRQTEVNIQNLSEQNPVSKGQISKSNTRLERKQRKLVTIQASISQAENDYRQAQDLYRRNVTNIYLQCRTLEEERLIDIRQVQMEFVAAILSSEHAEQQSQMYGKLMGTIEMDQDTNTDLDFWAKTYGVLPSKPSADSQINPITTADT